jgi:hypothetical protein
MNVAHHLRALAALPPREAGRRVAGRLRRELALLAERFRVAFAPTYARTVPGETLARRLPAGYPPPPEPWRGELAQLAAAALEHRFDLLGSGPVRVAYGAPATGVAGVVYAPQDRPPAGANPANRRESRRLAAAIDDPGYRPIDWQLDFKSGHRFDARLWRGAMPVGARPGVDVKVPWELARMYHLPRLALAARAATDAPGDARFLPPARYAGEFRNQVLDFAATNPPRFGVNWVCPMEAGLRAANILLAHDLFDAAGIRFDAAFEAVLVRLVREHGLFIAANMEWDEIARGNHYLADVAGLAFIAAYLPRSPRSDAWLAFAARALAEEMRFQFHDDGGNFEASTAYHRLSTEMALYATAVIIGLPEEKRQALADYDHRLWSGPPKLSPAPAPLFPFPAAPGRRTPFAPEHFERLRRAVRFAADAAKPDGRLPQVGDNDSGRLYSLRPGEDGMDHRHLADAGSGLFADPALAAHAGGRACEGWLVAALAGLAAGERIPAVPQPAPARLPLLDDEAEFLRLRDGLAADPGLTSRSLDIPLPAPAVDPATLTPVVFPDFGLYVLRGGQFYLAVRCPEPGPRRLTGHAHCDLLCVELHHAGRDLVADPGSYLYTPFPALRNAYRGPLAHFAPLLDGVDPADLRQDLFALPWRMACKRLAFCRLGFIGEIAGQGQLARRVVEVRAASVRVTDFAPSGGAKLLSPFCPEITVTHGYGTKTTRPVCAF